MVSDEQVHELTLAIDTASVQERQEQLYLLFVTMLTKFYHAAIGIRSYLVSIGGILSLYTLINRKYSNGDSIVQKPTSKYSRSSPVGLPQIPRFITTTCDFSQRC